MYSTPTPTLKENIEHSFSIEEVREAIFSMNGNKSPCPDDFSTLFF